VLTLRRLSRDGRARRPLLRQPLLRRPLPRRAPAALPDALRARLEAIPGRTSAAAIVPRSARGVAGWSLEWLVATPWMPLAASFVLATGLSLAGNPYRLGVVTIVRLHHGTAPVQALARTEAAALGTTVARLARSAVAVLPGASLRASQTLSASLADRIYDDEDAPQDPAPASRRRLE